MSEVIAIPEISGADMAFGTTNGLPAYGSIPKEFKNGRTKWNELFSEWFFGGLKSLRIEPVDGVDKDKALAHVRALMASFEPSHEHKEAGVAYLMSKYFSDAEWQKR